MPNHVHLILVPHDTGDLRPAPSPRFTAITRAMSIARLKRKSGRVLKPAKRGPQPKPEQS